MPQLLWYFSKNRNWGLSNALIGLRRFQTCPEGADFFLARAGFENDLQVGLALPNRGGTVPTSDQPKTSTASMAKLIRKYPIATLLIIRL